MPQVTAEIGRQVAGKHTICSSRVCVFVEEAQKIHAITQSRDRHTAVRKCGNLAHGDDAIGRQPLLQILVLPGPSLLGYILRI